MALESVATAAFERDYDSALAYITYELGAPQTAVQLIGLMDEAVARIADNPLIHAVSRKPTLTALEYREAFIGNYIMLYKVENETVVTKRLFHMSQDYESYV